MAPARCQAYVLLFSFPPFYDDLQLDLGEIGTEIPVPEGMSRPEARDAVILDHVFAVERAQELCAKHWSEHPMRLRPEVYGLRTGFWDEWPWNEDPHDPPAMAVFEHRPGRGGETRSYYIASFASCASRGAYRWCLSKMGGRFAGILPVSHDVTFSPYRLGYINNSAHTGASRGYFCRMRLKKMLPTRTRKYVGQARKANNTPKIVFLKRRLGTVTYARTLEGKNDYTRYTDQATGRTHPLPDWYTSQTKAELWLASLPPHVYHTIAAFMDPMDFWLAATGRMHPADLDACIKRRCTPREVRALGRGQMLLDLDVHA